jgi:hypothetical protein
VELQIEAVRQQVLKHDVEIVDAIGMVRSGLDVKLLAGEPIRASDDLATSDSVHNAEHVLNGYALRVVADAVRDGIAYPSGALGWDGLIDATSYTRRTGLS